VPAPLVLKFGGELLEDEERLRTVVDAIAQIVRAQPAGPVVIVHGGGKEIDRAIAAAGIARRQVDGLRITDEATLGIVVPVLAGTINTRFVAALVTAGVAAVGLTGADAACGLVDPAPPHLAVDGRHVDLGRVGTPRADADMRLLRVLMSAGFVPVVACVGLGRDGRLFNVNADTLAGHLAGRLAAERLVIAGTTSGVLDERGATIPALDPAGMTRLVEGGTATAGMIAKLRACAEGLALGAREVIVADGRDADGLASAARHGTARNATRMSAR
jgi:acetylglutamate kinase